MTNVEYGNGLEEKLFGDLAENGGIEFFKGGANCDAHFQSTCTGCVRNCASECNRADSNTNSSDEIPLRPTLPKITSNTPSLLETYVSTVGAEKVTPEERTLLTKLEGLDLDPIKVKLMDAEEGYGWTREQADSAANAYKQFLFINAKYDGSSIVPNKLVDKVWHYHILDTGKYREDCQQIFGSFLHHFPYFGLRGEEDAENLKSSFAETQDLFVKNFGTSQLSNGDAGRCKDSSCNSHCTGSCSNNPHCESKCSVDGVRPSK